MARSNAERQAKYRKKRRLGTKDDIGSRRLDCWLPSEAFLALGRLARHQGQTKQSILESLIVAADEENLQACATDEDLDEYLGDG